MTKILIVYASRSGATAEAAQWIAEVFLQRGAEVDLRPVKEVKQLGDVSAVVLGSGVRAFEWFPEAVNFLKKHENALAKLPVAFFTVCLEMGKNTPVSRVRVMGWLKPVLKRVAKVKPVDYGFFGGLYDPQKAKWLDRTVMSLAGFKEKLDFRKPEEVRAWAEELAVKLGT